MEIQNFQISVKELIEGLLTSWADSVESDWIWPLDPQAQACWAFREQSE